jgi:hypothetical protein
MISRPHQNLLEVLRDAREFLARPCNDFAWSSWDNCEDAVRQMDDLIRRVESGDMPDLTDLTVLFAPTGDIQEVAESSGWGQEFLKLARRFDAVVERI